jgi:hypothetical protein
MCFRIYIFQTKIFLMINDFYFMKTYFMTFYIYKIIYRPDTIISSGSRERLSFSNGYFYIKTILILVFL